MDEQWLDLQRVLNRKNDIVAISNTGKYRRFDGTEGPLRLRQYVKYYGNREKCSHLIAENFLITVKRPDQILVDHITHNPTEYNVNNVLNLRWCTAKENSNFEEAKYNHSGEKHPMYGKGYLFSGDKNHMYGRSGENSPRWKGDNVGTSHAYHRALSEFRRNPTQENLATLEDARLRRNEYRNHLRRAKKSRQ